MTEGDRKRAVYAEVIANAWRDATYRGQLQKDPKATLTKAGLSIPPSMDVVYLENTPTVINAILPPKEDAALFQAQVDHAVKLLDFLPPSMEVRIHRDGPDLTYFVLPVPPRTTGELTEAELEHVAGGKDTGGGTSGGAVMGVLIGGQPELTTVVSTVTTVQTVASAVTVVAGVVGVVGAVDVVVALVVVPILIT
jgi:hypothetical protein